MHYLNLGCGKRYIPSWKNIDFTAHSEFVSSCDLQNRIPLDDNTFNLVYHSHVLEHFSQEKAQFFIEECYRVLQPYGVIRVVVPDLEDIARNYLAILNRIDINLDEFKSDHEWMTIEMLDQMVRRSSGGEMVRYISKEKLDNKKFIISRMGSEIAKIIKSSETHNNINSNYDVKNANRVLKKIYLFLRNSNYRKEILLKLMLGEEYYKLQIGRFSESGELHQWMYDRVSLAGALKKVGFVQIIKRNAYDSYIPKWSEFNLDTESDGSVYKPQSLYMEAIKPSF